MRYYDDIIQVAGELSTAGVIVLAPFVTVQTEMQDGDLKKMLDDMHYAKIDVSSAVCLVTDSNFYFGQSTENELRYADSEGKPIFLPTRRGEFVNVSLSFLFEARRVCNGQ